MSLHAPGLLLCLSFATAIAHHERSVLPSRPVRENRSKALLRSHALPKVDPVVRCEF